VWGPGALWGGLAFAALIIPVFAYRHFVCDKGEFPQSMYEQEPGGSAADLRSGRRAGAVPFVALAGGVAMVSLGQYLSHLAG
jgi:hypothetical protein